MQYIASISHGKDSIAMLHIIKDVLNLPLDRIITVDVWFDENTRAELPPMVEWKEKADKIIFDKWGIPVEHLCATRGGQRDTYSRLFYKPCRTRKHGTHIYGFPKQRGAWCNSKLKVDIQRTILSSLSKGSKGGQIQGFPISISRGNYCNKLKNIRFSNDKGELVYERLKEETAKFFNRKESGVVQYIGIAYDEPKRIERHKDKPNIIMPLVEAEWTEQMCYEWCEQNNLLAPTYTTSMRDGCWFCHNQGVGQLRNLYHNYPELWTKLLQLDTDSPVTFHADGHTVHDFDKRFKWEDAGYKKAGSTFRWSDINEAQMNIYQFLEEGGSNDE